MSSGLIVGGIKLDVNTGKMFDLAAKIELHHSTFRDLLPAEFHEFITVALEAGAELKRLADGFESFGQVAAPIPQHMLMQHPAVADECDCPNCVARRAAEASGVFCDCPACIHRRALQAAQRQRAN